MKISGDPVAKINTLGYNEAANLIKNERNQIFLNTLINEKERQEAIFASRLEKGRKVLTENHNTYYGKNIRIDKVYDALGNLLYTRKITNDTEVEYSYIDEKNNRKVSVYDNDNDGNINWMDIINLNSGNHSLKLGELSECRVNDLNDDGVFDFISGSFRTEGNEALRADVKLSDNSIYTYDY